jgi:nitrate reductase / nitrite oxidoreductase, beta subunit
MVWYVPPLSPVMSLIEGDGATGDPDDVFAAIDELRIPVRYLANMLSASDEDVVRMALRRLATMRSHMRRANLGIKPDPELGKAVGMTGAEIEDMYRLLAIAKYDDRYVIPKAHREVAENLSARQGGCGLDFAGGPGSCGASVDAAEGEARIDLVELAITRQAGQGG